MLIFSKSMFFRKEGREREEREREREREEGGGAEGKRDS